MIDIDNHDQHNDVHDRETKNHVDVTNDVIIIKRCTNNIEDALQPQQKVLHYDGFHRKCELMIMMMMMNKVRA